MSVAWRIATGFGLLVTLLAAALAYHTILGRELLDAHRALSESELPAALLAYELENLIAEQEEVARKLFALRDPGYAERLDAFTAVIEERLRELAMLETGGDLRRAIEHLEIGWQAAGETVADARTTALDLESPGVDQTTVVVIRDLLQTLAARASAVREVAQRAVAARRERVQRMSERIQRLDLVLLTVALAAGTTIAYFTARSITRPLGRLVDATRAVADGRFDHRLPAGDDELGRVAAAFNEMSQQLGDLDRLKRDFVARAAHDLRTPLVAMAETAGVLLDELAGPLDERQRRLVELNRQGARRLLWRMQSLLDLSRIDDAGLALERAEHDLVALTHAVLGELAGRARRRRIRLIASLPAAPLVARCDGDRIARVLENLLDNAIRLSPPRRRIVVELAALGTPPAELPTRWRERLAEAEAADPGWARFTVEDRGPGLDESDKERVFRSVYRPGDAGRDGPRTGLGLAICRDIVAAHRGAIWVEDAAGGGSRFHVLLPRRPRDDATGSAS